MASAPTPSEPAGVPGPRVWSVVKASISEAGRSREDEFNAWYNQQHVPEWVDQPGFLRGWRLRALEHSTQTQSARARLLRGLRAESVAAFNDALARSHGVPWGEWQEYVGSHLIDWERTYYRTLAAIAPDAVDAPCIGRSSRPTSRARPSRSASSTAGMTTCTSPN